MLILVVRLRLFGHHELALLRAVLGQGIAHLAAWMLKEGPAPPRRPPWNLRIDPEEAWPLLLEKCRALAPHPSETRPERPEGAICEYAWDDPTPACDAEWSVGIAVHVGDTPL